MLNIFITSSIRLSNLLPTFSISCPNLLPQYPFDLFFLFLLCLEHMFCVYSTFSARPMFSSCIIFRFEAILLVLWADFFLYYRQGVSLICEPSFSSEIGTDSQRRQVGFLDQRLNVYSRKTDPSFSWVLLTLCMSTAWENVWKFLVIKWLWTWEPETANLTLYH